MEDHVHILSHPLEDRLLAGELGARRKLAQEDGRIPVRGNLAETQECGVGLLDVLILLQPVGADEGRVEDAVAGDGHVAARLGGEEDCGEGEEVVVRTDSAHHGAVLKGQNLDVRPVRGICIQVGPSGLAEVGPVGCGELLKGWIWIVSVAQKWVRHYVVRRGLLPMPWPVPMPDRGPD